MNKRTHTKLLHEGKYVAEVEIEVTDSCEGWSPTMSLDDALRLDDVREALRRGDIAAAERMGRVYELVRVHAAS